MRFVQLNGRRYAQFERLAAEAGLVHAFSTRPMDVSPTRGADGAAQRRQMAEDLNLDASRLRHCHQVHGGTLALVERVEPAGRLPHCDGAATAVAGLPLMTFSADCPLVLAYDPVRRVLGMVHASWRCTVAAATRRLVDLMTRRCGCAPPDLLAGIGPGAGPCCYEVRADVYEAAAGLPERARLFSRRQGRLYFDLWEANRAQLVAGGVPAGHIETAGLCTMCHNELFYSFRREGQDTGHFGLMAAVTNAIP